MTIFSEEQWKDRQDQDDRRAREADEDAAAVASYGAENPPPFEADGPLLCPVPGCREKTTPGVLREFTNCPVHGEQWVGETTEL